MDMPRWTDAIGPGVFPADTDDIRAGMEVPPAARTDIRAGKPQLPGA